MGTSGSRMDPLLHHAWVQIRPLKRDRRKSTLKTLTSLNKEVRPFFLGDSSIWSFASVSSLSDYSISEVLKANSSLAIKAFGAFQFIDTKYYYRSGKMESKETSLLI